MAKKAAAQNGRADLPVSQDARLVASKQSGDGQRVCDWHASHYVKVMLDQILQLSPVVKKFAELEGLGAHGKCAKKRNYA